MRGLIAALSGLSGFGYALVRCTVGLILFAHGYQKVFEWQIGGMETKFEQMGVILPQITGPFIGLLELIGGALLFVGLFTRYLGVLFGVEFIVATYFVWVRFRGGFYGSHQELLLLVVALLFATNGAGRLSVDSLLRRWDA